MTKKRAATTRQGPGRWLFVFPAVLLLAAGWFTVNPWQSSASSPVGQEFVEDLYSPERYRVLADGMIEDTATGLRRKLDTARITGSSPSAADIRAFISLTDDQRADLRNGVGPRPVRVIVEAIGLDTTVIPIGLDVNRALSVPRNAEITGWWSGGYVPGEIGPTVIVGHFDSKVASGVFSKLQTLRTGAQITVEDSLGSKYVYEVVELEHLRKTSFPTKKVYGPTDGSTLRLITCGGKFNRATGHYVDNTIAYANLVSADIVGQPEPLRAGEDLPIKIAPVFPLLYLDDFEDYVDAGAPGSSSGPGGIAPGASLEDFPSAGPVVNSNSTTMPSPGGSPTLVSVPSIPGGVPLGEVVSGIPSTLSGAPTSGASASTAPPSGPGASLPVAPVPPVVTVPVSTVPSAATASVAPLTPVPTATQFPTSSVAPSVPSSVSSVSAGVTVPSTPSPTLSPDPALPNTGANPVSPVEPVPVAAPV